MLRNKPYDGVGLLLVVLSGWVLTHGITQRFDIVATDDDVYFVNGLNAFFRHEPLPIQMAPLFSGWYLLLYAFTQNVIDTYYLSWVLLSVLPGVFFYVLLRSLRVSVPISVVVSVLYLFSPLNFPLDQKVSPFTMLWLMGGLIAANYQTDPVGKLTATATGALLAAYARPEFFLSFLALCVLAIGVFFWQRRKEKRPLPYPLLALMGVAALLVLVFGSPMSGQRSVIAFAQHFAMNYNVWHPEVEGSPWMHSKVFVVHGFGREVTSLADAFFLNPSLFMKHITFNVVNGATNTVHFLRETFLTSWLSHLAFPGRRYVLLAGAGAVLLLTNWRQTVRNLRQAGRAHGWYWLCVLAVVAPTFLSCIVLLPRAHYVVFQMILYVSLIGVVLQAYSFRDVPAAVSAALPYVAFGLLVLFLWPRWQANDEPKPTPVADLLRSLKQLPIQEPVHMTGNVPLMYRLYLNPNWTYFYLGQYRPTSLEAFLHQYRINCLHIRPDVLTEFGTDPYLRRLLADPGALGFVRHSLNVPDQYILVHRQSVSINHPTH